MKDLSLKKKLLLGFLVVITIGVLLELGLRILNIGSLLNGDDILLISSKNVYSQDKNDPSYLVSSLDQEKLKPFKFKKVPDDNVFRIFLLGSSNVYQLPQEDLESYLNNYNESHKHITYEVINAGVNDFGSKRLTLLANEILDYKPNMIFIYMGHNEFRNLLIDRKVLKSNDSEESFEDKCLSKLHLYNLVRSLFIPEKEFTESQVEKYFYTQKNHPSSVENKLKELNKAVYDQFYENLKTIVNEAKNQGVYVILCTVVPNEVRDPDYSLYPEELSDYRRSYINKLVVSGDEILGNRLDFLKNNGWTDSHLYPHKLNEEGIDKVFPIFYDSLALNEFTKSFVQNYKKLDLTPEERNIWEQALKKYELANDVYPESAQVNHRIALVYYVLGDDDNAHKFFNKAMELDRFPLRATNLINDIIRKVAKEENVDKFYDFDELFRDSTNRNIYDFSVLIDDRNLLMSHKDKIIHELRQLIIDYNNIKSKPLS